MFLSIEFAILDFLHLVTAPPHVGLWRLAVVGLDQQCLPRWCEQAGPCNIFLIAIHSLSTCLRTRDGECEPGSFVFAHTRVEHEAWRASHLHCLTVGSIQIMSMRTRSILHVSQTDFMHRSAVVASCWWHNFIQRKREIHMILIASVPSEYL